MRKKKKIKKKSLKPIPVLKRKAWEIFSKYVRLRDNFICFTCRVKEKPGQAGHYIHGRLDYDPVNVHHQCVRCNKWLHGNLGIYGEKMTLVYGFDVVQDLRLRSNQIWKPSREELEQIYEHWKEEYIKLGGVL
jgi:hypothetical protein